MSTTRKRIDAPRFAEEVLGWAFRLMDILKAPEHDMVGLTDGVTEPDMKTGIAQIYVDSADGDLKIKFGDGTVKTIVVDS